MPSNSQILFFAGNVIETRNLNTAVHFGNKKWPLSLGLEEEEGAGELSNAQNN
jgi:hypothetical protein